MAVLRRPALGTSLFNTVRKIIYGTIPYRMILTFFSHMDRHWDISMIMGKVAHCYFESYEGRSHAW